MMTDSGRAKTLRLRLRGAARWLVAAVGAALLSGCWTVSTQVVERDMRHWQTPEVAAQSTHSRHSSEVRRDDGMWHLDLAIEVADECVEVEYRELHEVEEIDREPRKKLAVVPLVAGIVTMVLTPVMVYYASTQTTDPLGNPVDPQPAQLGTAAGVGLGVGGGLTIGGIVTADVTRRGAGHHERLLVTREEELGPVTSPVPCGWRPLPGGTGMLRTGLVELPFTVSRGRTSVVLPSPSAEVGFEWQVELAGLPSPDPVVLVGSEYDREARRLKVAALLGDLDAPGAADVLRTMEPEWEGYGTLVDRYRGLLYDLVDDSLEAGEPTVGVALARTADRVLPEPESRELLTRTLAAATRDALERETWEDARTAATELGGLGEDPVLTEVKDGHESHYRSLLDDGLAAEAQAFAHESAAFMGYGWKASADERLIVARVRLSLDDLGTGARTSHDQSGPVGPEFAVGLVVEAALSIQQQRLSAPPTYPSGVEDATIELARLARSLLDRSKLKSTYSAWWEVTDTSRLPSRVATLVRDLEWLNAFDLARPVFGDQPGFDRLGGAADGMRARLAEFLEEIGTFSGFADDFAVSVIAAELSRTAPLAIRAEITGMEAEWGPCRRGERFVQEYGASAYKEQATMYCRNKFPSEWTFREGTSSEHRAEVGVRACERFFASPAGCR